MRLREISEAVGRITKQNQTADVGPQEIKTQAAKFGNTVDKDGRPPSLSKKTKGSKTNVLFNLGLAESIFRELDIPRNKMPQIGIKDLKKDYNLEKAMVDPRSLETSQDQRIPGMVEKTVQSIKDGFNKPLVIDKNGFIVNGHHRYDAYLELGADEIPVVRVKDASIGDLVNDFSHTAKDTYAEDNTKACPRTKAARCQCEQINTLAESDDTITAVCVLEQSDTVEGTILLKQQAENATLIVGKITGLEPGEHGFHIHEFGDLSNGCESAGGHYNPDGVDHGDLEQGHVGDLGNVTADSNGVADIEIIAERVDLRGDRSVVGRSIVIHSDRDDLGKGGDSESLKTGNAGDRLACGVITLKETINEKWSKKYKSSINCDNPKGFSQKAHCAGKKKNEDFSDERRLKMYNPDSTHYLKKSMPKTSSADITQKFKKADRPDDSYELDIKDFDKKTIRKVLPQLIDDMLDNDKNKMVIKARFGLKPFDKSYTLKQIGEWLGVTQAVVRQREAKALRQLRHPSRSEKLRDLIDSQYNENFADGKKKGKSRPGRAKRAGVDCSKSVSALRKQAKNSSGEEQKMAHWCANMKSGRKK